MHILLENTLFTRGTLAGFMQIFGVLFIEVPFLYRV